MLLDIESDTIIGAFRIARGQYPSAVVVSDVVGASVRYPSGSLIMVFPFLLDGVKREPYRAIVTGTDLHRTKYRINRQMWPGRYATETDWVFPAEVVFLGTRGIDDQPGGKLYEEDDS